MAYSTRRKSVNLSLLGIQLPGSRPVQRSNPPSIAHDEAISPPSKKIKRSHSDASQPEILGIIPPLQHKFAIPAPKQIAVKPSDGVHTPPPSPPASGDETEPPAPPKRVDTEGINDDVVIATIEVLEQTDNRPHLLKELAAAISGHVAVVET